MTNRVIRRRIYIRMRQDTNEWEVLDADTQECIWANDGPKASREAEEVALRLQKEEDAIWLDATGIVSARDPEVDHPDHYGGESNPYEYVKVARAWGLDKDALLWTAGKYLCRQGKKGGEPNLKDLKKMRWYISERITGLEDQPIKFGEAVHAKIRKATIQVQGGES